MLIQAQPSKLMSGTVMIWNVREQTLVQIQNCTKSFSFDQVLLITVCLQRQVLETSLGVMIAQV